jgi:thioredoxin 1
MSENTVTLTDASFTDAIAADKPILVDFWAEWCGPCKAIAPILDEIADEYPEKITIGKLDADENPQTVADFGVMSIPTMIVFQGGEAKKRIVGARPRRPC